MYCLCPSTLSSNYPFYLAQCSLYLVDLETLTTIFCCASEKVSAYLPARDWYCILISNFLARLATVPLHFPGLFGKAASAFLSHLAFEENCVSNEFDSGVLVDAAQFCAAELVSCLLASTFFLWRYAFFLSLSFQLNQLLSLPCAYGVSVAHLSCDILLHVFLFNTYSAVEWTEQASSVVT